MERHTFAMEINMGKMNCFRRILGENWEQIVALLDRNSIHNFSIWNAEALVFCYYESAGAITLSEGDEEVKNSLMEKLDGICNWISKPGEQMRLMYHNFGIVRESKELIRHRMFMTRLKPGCAEEYKARHDVLVEKRAGHPDPGPDSNFSIWSAGGYIFGYNEIDTTMEVEETDIMYEETVAWETRQLGIMDWITNDVDWLTDEHHAASVRLAWHA